MTGNIIAHRYARALFELGQESGEKTLQRFAESLEDLRQVFDTSSMLKHTVTAPIFTKEEKFAVLTKISKKLKTDPMVLNFCLLLTEKNRINDFNEIVQSFRQLLDEAQGIIRGSLTTAVAVSEEKQQQVVTDLQKKSKRKLVLDFNVAPEILGGVILKLGDVESDASLRTQLSTLKDSIKKGE